MEQRVSQQTKSRIFTEWCPSTPPPNGALMAKGLRKMGGTMAF